MASIVVVEQSDQFRHELLRALMAEGYEVWADRDCSRLPDLLRQKAAGLVLIGSISDEPFASIDAIRSLQLLNRAPVLFMPARSSEQIAIAALRLHVAEYLPPPAQLADVISAVHRLVVPESEPIAIVGAADALVRLKSMLPRIASSDCSVLITGETGTGKELVAEHLHFLGSRRARPFVTVNCAAIPDTLLESELFGYERGAFTGANRRTDGILHAADGGTLFLDEIGDMSLVAQSKILRAIETGKIRRVGGNSAVSVNVRFVAATNQDLENMVQSGRFRSDLYFRMNVARIELPPLRERPEDIPLLIRHFLGQSTVAVPSVSDEVVSMLVAYSWPGNIRELKNVLQTTLIYLSASEIRVEDLPDSFLRKAAGMAGSPPGERNRLLAALEQTRWNKSRAAEELHWSRMTLYRKMAKHRVGPRPPSTASPRVNGATA